jgi:hypothetical protein
LDVGIFVVLVFLSYMLLSLEYHDVKIHLIRIPLLTVIKKLMETNIPPLNIEQEHSGLGKSDKKRLCGLMDCKKLSPDACAHAVQNERLPLRIVVQVLYHEQTRASTAATIRADSIGIGSYESSRSAATTNTEDEWDGVMAVEDLSLSNKATKLDKCDTASTDAGKNHGGNKGGNGRVKGASPKKALGKVMSSKGQAGERSSSDSSDSAILPRQEHSKRTPARSTKSAAA